MTEKEPSFIIENGSEDTRLTQAINGSESVLEMIKLLEESEKTEIRDPHVVYPLSDVITTLNNLEEIVLNVSEDNINSIETHDDISEYLSRVPENYSLRQHTLRLLSHINPVMKKFIF
jgi:hypothetical protein